ncbi:hypothetical protein B0H10DRAFT_1966129 [Mycena sp. CBHHK59/15]|nr:hypothetical protein B0H10DRAFT_1966129 [Mycena sp. CBHHK59/15]
MAGRRHTRRTAPSPPRPPEDPAQGVRTRQAGRNAAAGPPRLPPHALLAREIKHMGNQTAPATQPRSTGTRQLPAVNPAPSRARASPAMIFPQTPARRADSDGDMSDDFPVIPRTRPLRAPALLPAAESDDENPPPRAPARTRGTSRRRGRGSAAAPTHAATTNDNEPGSVPQARVRSWFKSYHPPPSPSKY